MPVKKTNYEILGVPASASQEDIKRAYKKLAMKYHPDRNADGDKDAAEEKFKEINNAYQALTGKNTSWAPQNDDRSFATKAEVLSAFNKAAQSFTAYSETIKDLTFLHLDARWKGLCKKGVLGSIFFRTAGEKDASRMLHDIKFVAGFDIRSDATRMAFLALMVHTTSGPELMGHIKNITNEYQMKKDSIDDCLEVLKGNRDAPRYRFESRFK